MDNERVENALSNDPALRQRMSRFIAEHRPEIERLMRKAVRGGSSITALAGLMSDGKGPVPKITEVVPLELVQPLVAPLQDCWPELDAQFAFPHPAAFPVLVFFEGSPGFAQLGVEVRDVGAPS